MGEGSGETRAPETRARRRIRQAVESRGFRLVSLEWEPWYDAGEMVGLGGGWYGVMDRSIAPNIHPGNNIMGLSVEEVVANVDHFVPPPEPCDCPEPSGFYLTDRSPTHRHLPECKWRLNYWLPWWGPKPKAAVSGSSKADL